MDNIDAPEPSPLWPPLPNEMSKAGRRAPSPVRDSRAVFKRVLVYGLIFLLGSFILTSIDHNLAHLSTFPEVGQYLLQWLPWVWLAILVHELGHALTALRFGWGIQTLAVFPLVLQRKDDRFKLSFRPAFGQYLGHVTAWPKSVTRLRRHHFLLLLAGPLASLVWAAFALLVHGFTNGTSGSTIERLSGLWASSALVVLLFMPLSLLEASGDLRGAWSVWRGDRWARETEALYTLNIEQRRPREWPNAMMELALQGTEESPYKVTFDWFVFHWASDLGNLPVAAAALERLFVQVPEANKPMQAFLWCEAAVFNAIKRGDLPSAQEALKRDPGGLNPDYDVARLRAEASVLLVEGHRTEAFNAARASEEFMLLTSNRRPAQERVWVEQFLSRAGATSLNRDD